MAIVWTPTASPAILSTSTNVATFSNVSIGTAASDRIVVVGVGNNAYAFSTMQTVTVNGTGMTRIGTTPFASLWWGLITAASTASVVCSATVGDSFQLVGIQVATMTGALVAAPYNVGTHAQQYSPDPQQVTATVPAGGLGIVFAAAGSPAGVSPTWSDATGDSYAHSEAGNSLQVMLAHTTTAGPVTASMFGGYDYTLVEMVMASFSPGGNTYTSSASDAASIADASGRAVSYARLIGKA